MDTHAVYEGAMRLLAARQEQTVMGVTPDITGASDADIRKAVDIAWRTFKAAGNASGFMSKAITTASAAPMTGTRTDVPVPMTPTAPPSADAFRSAGAV